MVHFDQALVGDDGFLLQIGTLSGNPVASVAGLASLEILRRPGAYETIFATDLELSLRAARQCGSGAAAQRQTTRPRHHER